MEQFSESQIQTALRLYQAQKKAQKTYRERHPEKMCECSKRYYHRMKENNPDKYEKCLERARKRYVPVAQRKKEEPPATEPATEPAPTPEN